MSGREADGSVGAAKPAPAPEASLDRRENLRAAGPSSRRDPLAWAIALLGAFIACYTLGWALGLGDPAVSGRFTGVAAVPGGVILTLAALRLRRTQRLDPRTRLAWSIIALALIGYGAGALVRFAMGSVPVLQAVWPLGQGLEFAAYPLTGVALALLPKPPRTRSDLVLFYVDVAIVAWSAAMLMWHFFLFPAARDAGQDVVAAFGVAVFPVADLALVFAIWAIILRGLRESTQAALSVAGAALLVVFVGDMIAGIETLNGTYAGGGLAGVLYSVAWLGLATAAYLQWRIRDSDRPIRGLAGYAATLPWLPYIGVALAFTLPTIRDWYDIDLLRQHIPATALLMALVIVRLGLTARQSASFAAAERERLAAAVDQAAEAILTTNRDHIVNYVNPAFTRITGYLPEEVIGQSADILNQATDMAQVADMNRALERGESWGGRLVQRRRDGSTVELDMTTSPLRDTAGTMVGSVSAARDITHERTLEAQLAQAQRMEAVGRLAGGIAHDFNNILTAISGFAELAAAELPADHPVAADVGEILKSSERASALTRALLAFSRRQVMQARLVDLNEIVDGLTPMLGRLIGEDITLLVRLNRDLGLVMADRAQLEQVILNLTVNARDAMPGGGSLTIATANEKIDAAYARSHVGAQKGPYVTLVVSDTGVGMTPDVLDHAFEPFFTTKERGRGTGLGLSTALGIVQQSGGFVEVESEPNAGSVFTVHLPRIVGATKPDETPTEPEPRLGGHETILVAEDEDAVRTFVGRVLTGAGYRVLVAANGAEALATARAQRTLDLLFTDVVMPGMSGASLAARLAAIHPGVPVLYASGYPEGGVPRGVDDSQAQYLQKPFSAEILLARVREALDQGRAPAGTAV